MCREREYESSESGRPFPKNNSHTMPRIQTTRTVKIALYVLRIYLIVMLALILIKFLRIFG